MIRAAAFLVLGLGAVLAAPAAADWLVTRDGARVETRGPWRVKGAQVVFTDPGGRLSALRLADVDLEASADATREAAAARDRPAPPPPPPPKAVLKLTDEDLAGEAEEEGDEGDGDPDEEGADEEGADEEENGAARDARVEVASWSSRDQEGGGGQEIVGTLANRGGGIAAAIRLQVTVETEDGPFVTRAFLETSALAPGSRTGFRALLPGIYALTGDPTFEVESEGFSLQGPPGGESTDDEDRQNEPDEAGEPAG